MFVPSTPRRPRTGFPLAAILCLVLAACASINPPANVPASNDARRTAPRGIAEFEGDTALGLAFSGGGTRAAAFAFGVLQGLRQNAGADGRTDLDRVAFVSGVSGGSVTAAYFGLKGAGALADFRERFLIRNAEEDLSTGVDLANLARGLEGGINDSSRLPAWLDRNLFDHATMGDLAKASRPIVWINASDLYHRTPFVFSSVTFGALCSDFEGYPLSQAVAASAAVPVAFVPITLETFPQSCSSPLPAWTARAVTDPASGAQLRAVSHSLASYRDPMHTRYLKLADGGLTDNFGLSGLVIARAAASRPYMPLTADKAVQLRRVIFVVVNAGRPPNGEGSRRLEGPSGIELLSAVTDTAIDSAVRSGFDAFRLSLREWEGAVRQWRCSLPAQTARRHGAGPAWRCGDITFEVSEISFDRLDPTTAARLSEIPTRFRLPTEDVDLLISAGTKAVSEDPMLRRTTKAAAR